jgi:hypothetical protein
MSYTFEKMSRIGNDSCCIDQTTLQNVEICNYSLQNYYLQDCSMKKPMDLALTQPCIFYKGSFNTGAGGCNIDDNSKLLIGSIQTHPSGKVSLFHRPFATVPFLGRGSVDPAIEFQLLQGSTNTNKKSITNSSEKSYLNNHYTPLIPSVQKTINNPNNLVEDSASSGWVRGGLPSRDLTRDQTCYN